MAQIFANNAISTLASPLGISDTSMSIAPGTGSRWPVIAAPNFAYTTLEDAAGNIEIIKITAHTSGSTAFTIERGQQGTAARAYTIGDLVEMRLTGAEMNAWETDIDNLEATRSRHAGQAYTGAHDFSAASGVTLPAATSIGTVSAAEIVTLDGVTSNVQAQINAANAARIAGDADLETRKADINGETYTGTHNFTGAAVSVAAPTAANHAATKAYADGLAFSSALPVQAGNAGKFTYTDGANASWQNVTAAGTTFTPAGNIAATNVQAAITELDTEKQAALVSGSNINTVNSQSLLGAGNIDTYPVQAGNAGKVLTTNGASVSWEWGVHHQPLLALGII